MEWDPETNTYSSNGPSARASKAQDTVKRLEKKVADMEHRLADLERQSNPGRHIPEVKRPMKW